VACIDGSTAVTKAWVGTGNCDKCWSPTGAFAVAADGE